jgi:DNA-binding transcriptional LysR family regulator
LDKNGVPNEPGDLARHTGLLLRSETSECTWKLRRSNSDEITVPFKPRMSSDDIITLKVAAEAGMGIVALPTYLCRAEVIQGKLKPLLTEWTAGHAMITLLAPSRRDLLPSVRVFSNFLAAEFQAILGTPQRAQTHCAYKKGNTIDEGISNTHVNLPVEV